MFRVLNGYLLLSKSYEDRSNARPVRLLVSLMHPIHQGTVMLVFKNTSDFQYFPINVFETFLYPVPRTLYSFISLL